LKFDGVVVSDLLEFLTCKNIT